MNDTPTSSSTPTPEYRTRPAHAAHPHRIDPQELRHTNRYTGEELLPYDGRVGAMDACYLPSRGVG